MLSATNSWNAGGVFQLRVHHSDSMPLELVIVGKVPLVTLPTSSTVKLAMLDALMLIGRVKLVLACTVMLLGMLKLGGNDAKKSEVSRVHNKETLTDTILLF